MHSEHLSAMGTHRTYMWPPKRPPTLVSIAAFILFAALTATALFPQSSNSDPSIKGIPFDLWLSGSDSTFIPWEVTVRPSALSNYQRLWASITARITVSGLRASQGGRFLYVAQFTDASGKSYSVSGPVEIKNPLAQKTSVDIILDLKAFILPGDYIFAMSIYDSVTQKHSVAHRDFHVPPLKNDPLPNAWANLSPVNFLSPEFLPDGKEGDLDLPLKVTRPVRIEVIANTSPTHALSPSMEVYQNYLSYLIPELEALSQITVNSGSLDVVALDLENHKVAFEQDSVQTLDRQRLRDALNPQAAAVVSVSSLSDQSQEAKFFTSEVSKRISCGEWPLGASAPDPLRILIVVSNDMAFPQNEDLSPVLTAGSCNPRLFYIRTHFTLLPFGAHSSMNFPTPGIPDPERAGVAVTAFAGGPVISMGRRTPGGPHRVYPNRDVPYKDHLENTLAPLHPRVFEVRSPEDFRRAIASILAEASKS